MTRRSFILPGLLLVLAGGCVSHHAPTLVSIRSGWIGPTTRDLLLPQYVSDVDAVCDPPAGWKPEPLKSSSNHKHQIWLSPTGATAYGVIHFSLPLPVGENLAMDGFIKQMRKSEGDANLISRQSDPNLPGIRFVAEGGKYKLRGNLIVHGWDGWAIYAGTIRCMAIVPAELDQAERAREHTVPGQPERDEND